MNREIFKEMLSVQNKLNDKVLPNWRNKLSLLTVYNSILTEVAEYIELQDWKWWKKYNPEGKKERSREELVDVYHFLMSFCILFSYKAKDNSIDDLAKLFDNAYNVTWSAKNDMYSLYTMLSDFFEVITTSADVDEFSYSNIKELSIFKMDISFLENAISNFFYVVNNNFESLEEFTKYYYNKNILNRLRQDLGDVDNKYDRSAFGKPDSCIITVITKDIELTTFAKYSEEVYAKFMKKYKAL